jgi:hypothetical protein
VRTMERAKNKMKAMFSNMGNIWPTVIVMAKVKWNLLQ